MSEQKAAQYYQQHADKYATAAKAPGAVIFVKISPLADSQKREELLAKAQGLLDRAKAVAPGEFARLVEANSEDQATRYQGGDIGWVSRDAKPWELDPGVIEALFAVAKPGDFAPLVPTKKITWGRQVRENPLHLTPYD